MSSEPPKQTITDYVAIAVCPALITGLITSLVFFLLEVLYSGAFVDRLRWIFFFFVFGMVLVARMAMGELALKAKLYGPVLGFLTWIGMQMFVDYPDKNIQALSWAINLGLICLVSWCAYRLTWDCTNLDEETDINAEGVLQAAGIDADEGNPVTPEMTLEETPPALEPIPGPGEGTEKAPLNWWERYHRYREGRKKKGRTLGVWVVYFSLAALPLFGLGQALIPLEDSGRRQFAFWMLGGYVACGLGLLLTTCYLGLRRYLRQRNLKMPAAMTGVWLTVGGTLIALLLVLGAFLPRPHAEYSALDFLKVGSKERDASKYAVKGDNPGKDSGKAGDAKEKDGDKNSSGKDGKDGKGQGKDGKGQGKDGSDGGKDSKGSGKDGKGKDSSSQKDKDGGKDGKDAKSSAKDGEKSNQGKDRGEKDSSKAGQKDKDGGASGKKDKNAEGDKQAQAKGDTPTPPSPPTSALTSILAKLSPILKWIVFALIVIVILVMVLRSGLQFLSNFTKWAKDLLDALRNFWANLFGRPKEKAGEGEDEEVLSGPPRRPFSAFANPFGTGESGGMSPEELLRYTFAALQAWAWERDLGRHQGETPLEFANRIAEATPALAADVRRLAYLYARAVYSRGGLPSNTPDAVRQFWERLEVVTEQPLSAGA
jgi:hypothetical protein